MKNMNLNSRAGKENIEKMKSLMGRMKINESVKPSKVELTKLGPDNKVYGIVRENHEYYIKTSDKIDGVLLEDFQYIGGLPNKKQYAFESYSQALKKLNLKMISLNEQFEGDKVNVFENDNLFVEDAEEAIEENEYIEEMVGDNCSCGAETYCDASGKDCPVKDEDDINEGELKVDNVVQDGPKELEGNTVGDYKEVTDGPDKAPNDNSTGTESEGSEKATPKKTIKETKKGMSLLSAIERIDAVVESVVNKKKSLNETKYKLKVDDPTPAPEPQGVNADVGAIDPPSQDEFDAPIPDEPVADNGAGDKPFDDEPFDAGVEADEDSDPKKFLQQLAGKAGQTLRKYTRDVGLDLELEKFMINSIISATHTSQMDAEDQEDIIEKIKTSGNDAEGEADEPTDDVAPEPEIATGATEDPSAGAEGGIGESIQILPKDHKQVFKNAKLGVNESEAVETLSIEDVRAKAAKASVTDPKLGEELYYYAFSCEVKNIEPDPETFNMILAANGQGPDVDVYGDMLENGEEDFLGIEDLERIEREISHNVHTHDIIDEEDNEESLDIKNKKDMFVDDNIERMTQDYLNTHKGFAETEEPVVKPTTKPEPVKIPRRSRPYRPRPNINPVPKGNA
jgi:hypothetical protein